MDRGTGLVRVDLRGGTAFGAGDALDGGLLLGGVGTGDDSLRRFAGGIAAVGEGVGRDFAADGGFDTTTVEVVVTVCATAGATAGIGLAEAAAAALPDLL